MEGTNPNARRMPTSIKSCFTAVFFRTQGGRRMVDTVKVWFTGTLRADLPPRKKVTLPGGVVRFWQDGFGNCKAETELPKLLWGHNGRLVSNQAELDQCAALLRATLLAVVEFASWEWVLLDLCWQFSTRAADVILAHWFAELVRLEKDLIRQVGNSTPRASSGRW